MKFFGVPNSITHNTRMIWMMNERTDSSYDVYMVESTRLDMAPFSLWRVVTKNTYFFTKIYLRDDVSGNSIAALEAR